LRKNTALSSPQYLRKSQNGYAKLSRKFRASHLSGKNEETLGKSDPDKLFLPLSQDSLPQKEVTWSILQQSVLGLLESFEGLLVG
jgi:hypothetical protein